MTMTVQVTMLGARGVGKTSLLTAMYQQFDNTIGTTNLQLIPDLESAAILSERLAELKSLLDFFESTTGQGIASSQKERAFQFGVGRQGKAPSLELRFVDYPGEYHSAAAPSPDRERALRLVRESRVVLLAIDTPALMEEEGRWNEMINRTQQITGLFRQAYQDLREPRLVIFAPVKCEKYVNNPQCAVMLRERLKQEYQSLLRLLGSEALTDKVVAVITPIQTVGSVKFISIEVEDNQPHFYYRRIHPEASYNPQDCDQPLRYLLRFLLGAHYKAQLGKWGIFSFLRIWFGWDTYLIVAADKLAQGCKDAGAFEVIQGRSRLDIG